MTDENADNTKRNRILIWVSLGFILIGVAIFLYWLTILRFERSTDDAYVHGNLIEITPQVPGIVASINVDNTDFVKEGQVLVELSPIQYSFIFDKSKSVLGNTVRSVIQMFLLVEELEAELKRREAELFVAEKDYQNRVNLVEVGAVSREEFEHVEGAFISARANQEQTYYSLQAAYAEVHNTTVSTHPLVKVAADNVRDAFVNLQRCKIVAPSNGYVAMRSVQLGEFVELSEPLLSVIPLDELWIDANFKEIHLSKMRIGQSVKIISDIYGRDVVFQGKLMGINPGTGNVFSALPPQNATGNWIKIVQRVPVRISLDPKEVEKHPLWPGLSLHVTVDIHDTSNEMLSENVRTKPLYHTKVYQKQKEGVEQIISQIIQENSQL